MTEMRWRWNENVKNYVRITTCSYQNWHPTIAKTSINNQACRIMHIAHQEKTCLNSITIKHQCRVQVDCSLRLANNKTFSNDSWTGLFLMSTDSCTHMHTKAFFKQAWHQLESMRLWALDQNSPVKSPLSYC